MDQKKSGARTPHIISTSMLLWTMLQWSQSVHYLFLIPVDDGICDPCNNYMNLTKNHRPVGEDFLHYLPYFLEVNPNLKCAKGFVSTCFLNIHCLFTKIIAVFLSYLDIHACTHTHTHTHIHTTYNVNISKLCINRHSTVLKNPGK